MPAEGTTVLLAEQSACAALRIAGYACIVENGRITLKGKARDLAADEEVRQAYLSRVSAGCRRVPTAPAGRGRPT